MIQYQPELAFALISIQCVAALVGIYYYFKLKESHWKWFCLYLIFIFIQEFFWRFEHPFLPFSKITYYAFFGIPIQYLFFIWLYALKSLKKPNLTIIFCVIYLMALVVEALLKKISVFYSISLNIGNILLLILVVLEFLKQIRNENILKFYENKMFYVNLGVILFYVGTFPFFAFYYDLYKFHKEIWNVYYVYFLIANCLMYLLFIASFIWGKQK